MAKFSALSLLGSKVAMALPLPYRIRLPARFQTLEEEVTVLLFPHSRNDVIRSPQVIKALQGISTGSPILAYGGNFTIEQHRVTILRLGEFYWTDESYISIRTTRMS